MKKKKTENEKAEATAEGGEQIDRRKQRAAAALAQDKAEREAHKKAMELAEAQKREERLLYISDEEQWTANSAPNPFETPRDYVMNGDGGAQTPDEAMAEEATPRGPPGRASREV